MAKEVCMYVERREFFSGLHSGMFCVFEAIRFPSNAVEERIT